MYFNNDEKTRVLIGEAAIHLALNEQEINVESLLRQLGLMAKREAPGDRQDALQDACDWLSTYRTVGRQHLDELNWNLFGHEESDAAASENVVRLNVQDKIKR